MLMVQITVGVALGAVFGFLIINWLRDTSSSSGLRDLSSIKKILSVAYLTFRVIFAGSIFYFVAEHFTWLSQIEEGFASDSYEEKGKAAFVCLLYVALFGAIGRFSNWLLGRNPDDEYLNGLWLASLLIVFTYSAYRFLKIFIGEDDAFLSVGLLLFVCIWLRYSFNKNRQQGATGEPSD